MCDQWWSLAFRLLLLRLTVRYGIELPHRTQVGRGLYIGHFGSVTVNGRARLGDNVNIHKGVTIGAIAGPSVKAGVPVIGDRVWIGINAILVGGITVGDDAVILAGVYVDFDVPAGALVTHGPASLRSSHRAQHLIQNPV